MRTIFSRPKGFPALLAWFLDGFRSEMPDEFHSVGVWRDRKRRGDIKAYQPVGGSVIGSPRDGGAFETLVDVIDSPYWVTEIAEYEGHKDRTEHYAMPMRTALALLAGRGQPTDEAPFMARVLHRTALRDGDWQGACVSFGIPAPVARVYMEAALFRLYCRYEIEPPARDIPRERAIA